MKKPQNSFREARQRASLTQEKAAERLDFSLWSLQAYESGDTIPPFDRAIQMAQVYQCSLYELAQLPWPKEKTMYLYEPVRIRGIHPQGPILYGLAVREIRSGGMSSFTVVPNISADQELVRRLAERCTREQILPERLPEVLCAAFPAGGAFCGITGGRRSPPWPRRSSAAGGRPPRSCGSRCRRWVTCPGAGRTGPWGR